MKDFIEYLLKNILPEKNVFTVEEIKVDDSFFTYIIHVDKSIMGLVIGKNGKVINSIRNIAKVLAVNKKIKIKIDLSEN